MLSDRLFGILPSFSPTYPLVHSHNAARQNIKNGLVQEVVGKGQDFHHLRQQYAEHDHRDRPGVSEQSLAAVSHNTDRASYDRKHEPDPHKSELEKAAITEITRAAGRI